MRGFPLLNALLAALLFALAWRPIQATLGVATSDVGGPAPPAAAEADDVDDQDQNPSVSDLELRVVATGSIERLRIDYLGTPLLEAESVGTEIEVMVEDFRFPEDGLDLWVEADFIERPEAEGSDASPVALRLELEWRDTGGDAMTRTVWGDGGSLADSVFFQLPDLDSE